MVNLSSLSAQGGCGAVTVGSKEGHEDDKKAGAPLLWKKVEGAGLF